MRLWRTRFDGGRLVASRRKGVKSGCGGGAGGFGGSGGVKSGPVITVTFKLENTTEKWIHKITVIAVALVCHFNRLEKTAVLLQDAPGRLSLPSEKNCVLGLGL
ncbi:chloride channel B [Striga asiatica]|uniref:Chloride channel B n=1 Tax=Striga asiatica TaxID=4170 RepID=A0A5A7QP64_STRAF|nr:chloride channel B [Striga asiatica]